MRVPAGGSTPLPSAPMSEPGDPPRPVASGLGPRSIDGGIDQIVVDGVGTGIWLCGKRVIGPDPVGAIDRVGAAAGVPGDRVAVVCLCERHELDERYPDYVTWLDSNVGDRARWAPIPDLSAPDVALGQAIAADVNRYLDDGRAVVVHCGAGLGRAPTIAICALLARGHDLETLLQAVADSRPLAGPETGDQRDLVELVADLDGDPPTGRGER